MSQRLQNPLEIEVIYFQKQLKDIFNHTYELTEIQESLGVLMMPEPDGVVVYPDDMVEGI